MATILFVDPIPKAPYTADTLKTKAMGGTEASLIRVAEKLGEKHTVFVAQENRKETASGNSAARYIGYPQLNEIKRPDAVVVLRNPLRLKRIRRRYPHTKLLLWAPDLIPDWGGRWIWRMLTNARATLVLVSDFHYNQAAANIRPNMWSRALNPDKTLKMTRIYNPIPDELVVDGTPWDRNKLVFTSSPHKGLRQTLEIFQDVRKRIPELMLFVANPGYIMYQGRSRTRLRQRTSFEWLLRIMAPDAHRLDPSAFENVVDIGPVPHDEVLRHVRTSLCLFYLNAVFPETFGIVFAESNAVGTPVLTHPIGAAAEVLGDQSQITEDASVDRITEILRSWRDGGRPRVEGQAQFRLSNVVRSWESALGLR